MPYRILPTAVRINTYDNHQSGYLMTIAASRRRVLVTGGGTFLGDHIAAALVSEGADVTLLVRPGAEEKLGGLAERVRWFTADVWDAASLRGRARGHACVVHTVGSLTADPARGLTHQRLNFVSARNVANMCSSDGVPFMVLMSSANAPWLNGQYLAAKREAEEYLIRVGVNAVVVRAPVTYARGARRSLFWRLVSVMRHVPPFSWMLTRTAPLPVDIVARAVARAAMNPREVKPTLYAPDLRRLNTRDELAGRGPRTEPDNLPSAMETLPDDIPVGFRTREK